MLQLLAGDVAGAARVRRQPHRGRDVETSEGVYVVYLRRADLSGVYLTLNQGTTRVQVDSGKRAGNVLRERAARLRNRGKRGSRWVRRPGPGRRIQLAGSSPNSVPTAISISVNGSARTVSPRSARSNVT